MRKKGEERRYGSDAHRPSVTFTSFCICIRIYFIDSVVPLRLRRLVGGFSESVSKCQKYTKSEMIPEFFPPTFLPLNFELVFGKMNMLLKRDGGRRRGVWSEGRLRRRVYVITADTPNQKRGSGQERGRIEKKWEKESCATACP